MQRVQPDVIIAFGPTGLSHHVDHISMHHATLAAFERYRKTATKEATYYFWALEKRIIDEFDLTVDGIEVSRTSPSTSAPRGQARSKRSACTPRKRTRRRSST